jgi:hypothetical protein
MMLALVSFTDPELPKGWAKIENTRARGKRYEVFFFDYYSKLKIIQPDITKSKGARYVQKLQYVQSQFPLYVAKTETDSGFLYYILRPAKAKKEPPFIFDIDIVRSKKEYTLPSLENRNNYTTDLLKTIEAEGCVGELLYEYSQLVQSRPDKKELIGTGVRIKEGVFTRVIPYKETKAQFFKLIRSRNS